MLEKIKIADCEKKLGLTKKTLQKRLDFYNIPFDNNEINKSLVDRWLLEKKNFAPIEKIISDICQKITGRHVGKAFVIKLRTIASGNAYYNAEIFVHPVWQTESFGLSVTYVNKNDMDKLYNGLYEPIFFYSATDNEIFEYLLKDFLDTILSTSEKSNAILYLKQLNNDKKNTKNINEFLNYCRFKLKKDIFQMTNQEISKFINQANSELSGPATKQLINYYNYLKKQNVIIADAIISYNKHQNSKDANVLPYDINIYYSVAYMVFNTKYWKEHDMIQKAVSSSINAKVWLYHAMHYISAWRNSDIRKKLPRLRLTEKPEKVLYRIKKEEYTQQEYTNVAEQIFFKFKYQGENKKPEKIKFNSSAHPLRLNIAESVKPIFGMLAMLCEAHNEIEGKQGSLCEVHSIDFEQGYRFFGKSYKDILDGKVFSNRRANKSFMNLLSERAEDEELDGYMIAAYARSHTGGMDRIPEVTSKYLKAKMDGYTPDEIVKCLMERGVCSFVPYFLCSVIDKDNFELKRLPEQTNKMKSIGLSPAKIENLLYIDNTLYKRCEEQIRNIIKWVNIENVSEVARDIVNNIINDDCCGKEEGIYCLSKACANGCVYKQRESCVGCGNEMYTKTMFIALSQEINHQEAYLDEAKTVAEQIKRNAILENKLYPAAYEMLLAMTELYEVDIKEYKKILERSNQYGIIGDV